MRLLTASALCLFFSIYSYGQTNSNKLKISRLSENFYIYTTQVAYNGKPFPANGMYVVTKDGVVLFDTPWDSTQFQPLLDSILIKHNKKVSFCIATHFHEDRTAGLAYYKLQGIKTFTTTQTDILSKIHQKKRAEFLITGDSIFTAGQYSFEVYYPGAGHTKDNIIIWFEKEKILYGGCLIKSTEAATLGNLEDADIKAYANTIENVQRKCKNPKYVIPGHQDWRNKKSLQHNLQMARKLADKK